MFYHLLVFACGAQRVIELLYSRKNQRHLQTQRYVQQESGAQLSAMVLVHAGWFIGLLLEPSVFGWPVYGFVCLPALVLFILAQALRAWVMVTLKHHWNITVMVPEGGAAGEFVAQGPYRYMRHPNYLAVIIELASLPLVGGAYLTAVVCSVINAFVLQRRIKVEEHYLFLRPGYKEVMGRKRWFWCC